MQINIYCFNSSTVDEETSPKYIITFLTPSPKPSEESNVSWLNTLSPAEKIALILAITILLIIILTGICYNGRALFKPSRQKQDGRTQGSATNIPSDGLGSGNNERVHQRPDDRQGNGNQGNPQIVIYNIPHSTSTSQDQHQSRVGQSCHMSRDLIGVPRDSLGSPLPFGIPCNHTLGSLSHSAPNLSLKPPSPEYLTKLSVSRSAQHLAPPPSYTPLPPTAPPGDGNVFFDVHTTAADPFAEELRRKTSHFLT